MLIAARNAILAGAAPGPTPAYWGLCFTAEEPNCVVNMARRGALANINKAPVTLEYSTDDCETWTEFDATGEKTTPITLANIGDHVFFRAGEGGNDRFAYNAGAYRYFTLTGNVAASGDIMSLLDASNHSNYSLSGHSAFALAYLFYGCTSLTTAPSLPATTLASSCYSQMFYGCTSLTTAPSLPATTLAGRCYYQMFKGCTALTAAPSLPATLLVDSCYTSMFRGCTALTAAPSLPATSLAKKCCDQMFYGCTSLTTAPSLPATMLAERCYTSMFQGCTALTAAPSLPATSLAGSCYYQMFYGCTSLTTAPSLPATSLADSCYRQMFSGCTSLNEIEVGLITWTLSSGSNATTDWLSGVADTGTFRCSTALGTNETIERGANYCPEGWTVVHTDVYWGLCFTAEEPNVVVNMSKTGSPPAVTLETSLDGVTWTDFDADGGTTPVTLAAVGDKVYFRAGSGGNAKMSSNIDQYRYFTLSATCSASGVISSLLSQDTPVFNLSTDNSYAFFRLFDGCTSLTTAPSLPATTLADSCYFQMFYGCTSLTTAPSLPATTLADSCYRQMFYGCTSLVAAPSLPATSLLGGYACYFQMFSGCTALTAAPSLPATTLVDSCYYQMFYGCTSLTTAPALPATTLAGSCYYQMFKGCTALTAAPSLPATSLVSSCYYQMFYGCTSLASIRIGSTGWRTGATYSWVYNVAASGTFYCPTALGTDATITRSADYCPEGWTVVNTDA